MTLDQGKALLWWAGRDHSPPEGPLCLPLLQSWTPPFLTIPFLRLSFFIWNFFPYEIPLSQGFFVCLFVFSQNREKERTKGFGQRLGGQEWWTGPFRSLWLKSEPSDPFKGFVKWFYLTCDTWGRIAIKLMSFHLNRKLLMIEWQKPAHSACVSWKACVIF